MLLFTCATLGWAADEPVAREFEEPEDPTELLEEARRRTTRGGVLLGLGGAMGVGAGFTLLYDRGEPGEVSEESDLEMTLRSSGGGVLALGSLVTMLVGGHELGEASRLRRHAEELTVTVLPSPTGVLLTGRF